MTYTNIIPPDQRMTWDEARAMAAKEACGMGWFEALAHRIQITEPKPVDPALEAFKAASCFWKNYDELYANYRAELAKRGGRIVFDGEEG